jgi:hypothetical protein
MPLRRLTARLALSAASLATVALVAAGGPAGAAEGAAAVLGGSVAVFGISIAGLPAGELTLSHRREGFRYEAASSIRATGLVGAVARLRFEGAVAGVVGPDGRLAPERYTAFSRSTRSERDTEIRFEDGNPVHVSVVPPRSSAPDVAAQAGTLDPVSAAVTLLGDAASGEVCSERVMLFDGSRRSELAVGRAEQQDGALVCNGAYTRIEGEAHSTAAGDGSWPFRLVYLPDGNGGVRLQRIEAPTRFGRAVMERRG